MSWSRPAGGQVKPFYCAGLSPHDFEIPPPAVGGPPLTSRRHVPPPSEGASPADCAMALPAKATDIAISRAMERMSILTNSKSPSTNASGIEVVPARWREAESIPPPPQPVSTFTRCKMRIFQLKPNNQLLGDAH